MTLHFFSHLHQTSERSVVSDERITKKRKECKVQCESWPLFTQRLHNITKMSQPSLVIPPCRVTPFAQAVVQRCEYLCCPLRDRTSLTPSYASPWHFTEPQQACIEWAAWKGLRCASLTDTERPPASTYALLTPVTWPREFQQHPARYSLRGSRWCISTLTWAMTVRLWAVTDVLWMKKCEWGKKNTYCIWNKNVCTQADLWGGCSINK